MADRTDKAPPRATRDSQDDVPALKWLRRMKKLLSFSFSSFIVLCIGIGLSLLYLRSQSLPVTKVIQPSQMYDIHGALIDSLHSGENRQVVPLREISSFLVKATLAIEDQHFYDHFGFDVKGIVRAAIVNVEHMSKVQGAGTITQQLARNLYLTHERTWTRKVKETIYAIQMEMQQSKDNILQSYLNQIYYGHSTYGIEAAAQLFFNKNAKNLTLAESALLAGVPKGPRYYSPYYDLDNALSRQKIVLQTMVNSKFITQEEADAAAKEKLTFEPLTGKKPAAAPYFRDYIRTVATEKLGITEDQFDESGLKIYTTLDLRAQKVAEDVVSKYMDRYGELQAALIAIDPRNGYIKAMVGGRDYAANQFNRVFTSTRQPGSSFKPIMYLTALQQGFTPITRYKSEPTVFTYDDGRQTYAPSNFGNDYVKDYIDMRQAIARSDNIYAVHTILEIGPENVIAMARKMGIESPMKPLPSLALGTFPVSPFEMASAFGIIANQGVRVEPTSIVQIENSAGRPIYEAHPTTVKVVDPAPSYVLTHLMESVFEEGGTGSRVAGLVKRPIAGKSGTTNTDAWMVGFTPELSTAVWIGYDKDRNISAVESHLSAPIFAEFTEQVLESIPPKVFPIPEGVVTAYIDPSSGKLSNEDCPNSRMEAFIAGTEPTEYCTNQGDKQSQNAKKGNGKQNSTWWSDLKRWWSD